MICARFRAGNSLLFRLARSERWKDRKSGAVEMFKSASLYPKDSVMFENGKIQLHKGTQKKALRCTKISLAVCGDQILSC
jgi:hypothetical protein